MNWIKNESVHRELVEYLWEELGNHSLKEVIDKKISPT